MTKTKENRLVVADAGWAQTIPEWLLKEVERERLVQGFASLMGKASEVVGDAEACVYLYTLSLRHGMGYYLTQAYIYLTAKLMKERKPAVNLPDFAEKKLAEGLTPDEHRELLELKRELYRVRGGEIHTPLFDALRQLGKDISRREKK